jgi:hypothetical protein
VNLNEILYGGDGVNDDIDSILLNLIASTIPKWRTFNLLRRAHILNRLVDVDDILYGAVHAFYHDFIYFVIA